MLDAVGWSALTIPGWLVSAHHSWLDTRACCQRQHHTTPATHAHARKWQQDTQQHQQQHSNIAPTSRQQPLHLAYGTSELFIPPRTARGNLIVVVSKKRRKEREIKQHRAASSEDKQKQAKSSQIKRMAVVTGNSAVLTLTLPTPSLCPPPPLFLLLLLVLSLNGSGRPVLAA
jgi:hypothetical protein